jgi:hypothetical protein
VGGWSSWKSTSRIGLLSASTRSASRSQALHHFVELEAFFTKVRESLLPDGVLIVNDMIGRKGHMRWPEAAADVEYIWRRLPDRYKYNHQLKRFEPEYVNWDSSVAGFEGIRCHHILPLLIQFFHFETFVAFGSIIGDFVGRAFGPNFNSESSVDREFIDHVAMLDDLLIDQGIVKPTQVLGRLRTRPVENPNWYRHWSPEFCVRPPDPAPVSAATPQDLEWFEAHGGRME